MPTIRLQTIIQSNIQICFDLSRSIDLHKLSTRETEEDAIGGCTEGLIGLGEYVTWSAKHFGIRQKMTTYISAFSMPDYFRDEQLKGPFKYMKHDHFFYLRNDNEVLMTDVFEFQSPYGIFGRIFDCLVLKNYMKKFLIKRNKIINNTPNIILNHIKQNIVNLTNENTHQKH